MYDPFGVAYHGYGDGIYAPGQSNPETAPYQVAHRLLLAHSRVYRMYKQDFASQNGKNVSFLSEVFTFGSLSES